MSGLLLHKDDVFVHVSHREGYEGPMTVEEEGFLADSPMVCTTNMILAEQLCSGRYNPEGALCTGFHPCRKTNYQEREHRQQIPRTGCVHYTMALP